MQIQIVRHHGGAKNSDRDVKHVAIGNNFRLRQKTGKHAAEVRFGKNDLEQKTAADGQDQNNDKRFDIAKSFVLQIEHGQHVERRNADASNERDFEKQI